jgi:hypothetical protein
LKEIEHTSQWVGWLKGYEHQGTSPIAVVVAKPKLVGGEGETSQSSQASEYGSWQSIQPADHPAVSMSYAEGSGYEKGQSSYVLGVAGDDVGGEIFSDDEDEFQPPDP